MSFYDYILSHRSWLFSNHLFFYKTSSYFAGFAVEIICLSPWIGSVPRLISIVSPVRTFRNVSISNINVLFYVTDDLLNKGVS